MDAKRFLEEWQRMCHNTGDYGCGDCPVISYCQQYSPDSWTGLCGSSMSIDDLMSKVERWAKEHPRKTRLDDFKKKYPNAPLDESGTPVLMPWSLGYCGDTPCYACKKAEGKPWGWCWDQEVQEDETD